MRCVGPSSLSRTFPVLLSERPTLLNFKLAVSRTPYGCARRTSTSVIAERTGLKRCRVTQILHEAKRRRVAL